MSGHSDEIELNGVDLSPDMIRTASSKIAPDVINFKVGDVENLPYENNFFDFITCCRSFHHYPDKKKAVSEMYRILRPDGKLIIADGSREKILGKIIFGYIAKRMEKDVYFMLSHELKDLFRKNGFRKVVQKVFNPLAPLLLTVGTK